MCQAVHSGELGNSIYTLHLTEAFLTEQSRPDLKTRGQQSEFKHGTRLCKAKSLKEIGSLKSLSGSIGSFEL